MWCEEKNGITKLNIKTKLLTWFNVAVQNYSILLPTLEFALTDLKKRIDFICLIYRVFPDKVHFSITLQIIFIHGRLHSQSRC